MLLRPLWHLSPVDLKKSWAGMGNIDQFRWLPRADVQEALRMARDELGLKHVRAVAMYGPESRVLAPRLVEWNRPPQGRTQTPNWQFIDLILEDLLDLELKPIYTTCFTPGPLAVGQEVCWPDLNNISMPRSLTEWQDFVADGLSHHQNRFGKSEMETWYFESWNEPNLTSFFSGSKEDFFRLWSATWKAVKSVNPGFRFGGPSTARGEWIGDFLDFSVADGTTPDFLVSHVYNNDSESSPLSPFDGPASAKVKDSPHFATGVIRGLHKDLEKRGWRGEVHWNEWGRSWFPYDTRKESALEAAFIVKTMAEVCDLADHFAYWCLSDIYDQVGFQSSEFEGHYGMLSLHGLRKPAWFAHQLLNRLKSLRFPYEGGTELAGAIPTADAYGTETLIYTYPSGSEQTSTDVDISLVLPSTTSVAKMIKIDDSANNILKTWRDIGAPASPDKAQIDVLRQANKLISENLPLQQIGKVGRLVSINLQCPGIALVSSC